MRTLATKDFRHLGRSVVSGDDLMTIFDERTIEHLRSAGWAVAAPVEPRSMDVTLHASAARTANGTGPVVEVAEYDTLRLLLDVTAAAGTSPTLGVEIQTSFDGTTDWRSLGSFAQKVGVSSERKSFSGADRFVRASYTIGGTSPSFTFSIAGEAV